MGKPANEPKLSIHEKMDLGEPVLKVMREATRQALIVHHKLGQDVVTWLDGKPVIVPAAELLKHFDNSESDLAIAPPIESLKS